MIYKKGGDRVEAARDQGGFDAERADGVQVKERSALPFSHMKFIRSSPDYSEPVGD